MNLAINNILYGDTFATGTESSRWTELLVSTPPFECYTFYFYKLRLIILNILNFRLKGIIPTKKRS
jgi:hypothetical protein